MIEYSGLCLVPSKVFPNEKVFPKQALQMSERKRWANSLELGKAGKPFKSNPAWNAFDCIAWYSVFSSRGTLFSEFVCKNKKCFHPLNCQDKYDSIKAPEMAS